MNDIQKIANSMSNDDINEMALTTGAIPMAPLGDAGFKQSVKKKKRKKPKKYKADPQGKPEDGAILFSGVEDEKHIKEAGEKEKRKRRRGKPKTAEERKAAAEARKAKTKTETQLSPKRDRVMKRLPNIFRTGGIEELPNMDREEFMDLNRRVEGNQALRSAKSELDRIIFIFRQLKPRSGCRLLNDYNRIENIRTSSLPDVKPENDWEPKHGSFAGGIEMMTPSTGWWGVRNWKNATQLNKYMRLYVNNIYYKYIQQVRLLLDEHIILCDMVDCKKAGHSLFLSQGYCSGFDTDQGEYHWTLGAAVKELSAERAADFNLFRRRSRGKIRPESPEGTEKEMRKAKRASGEEIDLFKDYGENWRQFFDRDI